MPRLFTFGIKTVCGWNNIGWQSLQVLGKSPRVTTTSLVPLKRLAGLLGMSFNLSLHIQSLSRFHSGICYRVFFRMRISSLGTLRYKNHPQDIAILRAFYLMIFFVTNSQIVFQTSSKHPLASTISHLWRFASLK